MPDDVLRLRATVVSDQALAELRKFGNEIGLTQSRAGKGAEQANTQFSKLGESVKKVGGELKAMVPGLSGFGLGAAGVGAAAATLVSTLAGMSRKIVELKYASRELGLSEQQLKGFSTAAQQVGISAEEMMGSLGGFRRVTEDMALRLGTVRAELTSKGAGGLVAALQGTKDQFEQLKIVWQWKELANKEDPSGAKAKRLFEILQLGPRLVRLSWEQAAAAIKREQILTPEDEKRAEDYNNALIDLGRTWDGLLVKAGLELFPGVKKDLEDAKYAIEKLIELKKLYDEVVPGAKPPTPATSWLINNPLLRLGFDPNAPLPSFFGFGQKAGPPKPPGFDPQNPASWKEGRADTGGAMNPMQAGFSLPIGALWDIISKPFVMSHDAAAGKYNVPTETPGVLTEEDAFRQRIAREQEVKDAFGMAGYGVQAWGPLSNLLKNLVPENLPGAISKAAEASGERPATFDQRFGFPSEGATRGISMRGLEGTPAQSELEAFTQAVKRGTFEGLQEFDDLEGGFGGGFGEGGDGAGGAAPGYGIGHGRIGGRPGLGGGPGAGPGGVGPGGRPGGPGGVPSGHPAAPGGPGGTPGGPGGTPGGPSPNLTPSPGPGGEVGPAAALAFARQHLGEDEIRDQSKLQDFFRSQGMSVNPRTTAWCADFVNANLKAAGIKGTGSSAAGSFTGYGTGITPEQVQAGDIGVVRGRSPRTGIEGSHVGFLTGETRMGPRGLEVKMLGGNQGGTSSGKGGVSEQWRLATSLHLRRPPGPTSGPTATPSAQGPGAPAGPPSYQGGTKATWFDTGGKIPGWPDPSGQREGAQASRLPSTTPGIATPGRTGLGEWFQVTLPDGRTVVTQKTDVGPGKGPQAKGIGLDINAALATQLYPGGPGTFPSGKGGFQVKPLGKNLPQGVMPGLQPVRRTATAPAGGQTAEGHGVGGGGEGAWRRGGRNPAWARRETPGVGGGDEEDEGHGVGGGDEDVSYRGLERNDYPESIYAMQGIDRMARADRLKAAMEGWPLSTNIDDRRDVLMKGDRTDRLPPPLILPGRFPSERFDDDTRSGAELLADRLDAENRLDKATSPTRINGHVNVTVNSNGTKASTEVNNRGRLFQRSTIKQHRQMQRTEAATTGDTGGGDSGGGGDSLGAD